MSSVLMREKVPIYIAFITGFIAVTSMFFKISLLQDAESFLTNVAIVIAAFAVISGALSLIVRHVSIIQKRKEPLWWTSAYLVVVIVIFILIGVGYGSASENYQYLYGMIIPQVTTAMWGITGVFTFYSAVRAMRARNLESTILIITTILIVCGNMPIGDVLWSGFSPLKSWIFSYLSNAANRGLVMGSAIAAATLALETIVGKNRGWLGGRG